MSDTQSTNDGEVIFLVFIVSAMLTICAILSFTQRRTKLGRRICWGVPGILPPINFLAPSHRIIYSLAAGALSATFTNLVLSNTLQLNSLTADNYYLGAFLHSLVIFFSVLVVALSTYPMFACVDTPIPIVGYALGALYTDLFFSFFIYQLMVQLSRPGIPTSLQILSTLPTMGCLFAVLVWYHVMLVWEIVCICLRGKVLATTDTILGYKHSKFGIHIEHVKHLLARIGYKPCGWKCKALHYPLQYMIVAMVVTISIFQLTILLAAGTFLSIDQLSASLNQSNSASVFLYNFLTSFKIVCIAAPVVSCLLCYSLFLYLLLSLRTKLTLVGNSKVSMIKYPTWTLFSMIKCAGYQIAVVITGWLTYSLILYVIGGAIVLIVHIPNSIEHIGFYAFISLFWIGVVALVELVLCKFAFLTDQNSGAIIINNKRCFNVFLYVVFIYHIATGLVVSLFRVSLAALCTLLSLVRMDRNIFIKGFEIFDIVNQSFCNYVLVEQLMHNPVLLVFVKLLTTGTSDVSDNFIKQFAEYRTLGNGDLTDHHERVSKRARNRWFVAYTLVRNPSIKQLTASNLLKNVSTADNKAEC